MMMSSRHRPTPTTPSVPEGGDDGAALASSMIPELKDLLWNRYAILLGIKRRVHVLRAFVDDLDRVSRRKQFQIRNDIVWNLVLDARDKCVIDLYSLTVEMRHGVAPLEPQARSSWRRTRKQGLFLFLRDHYAGRFSRAYVPHPSDDAYEIEMHTKGKAAKFDEMFPGCAGGTPTAADVEQLCERFRLRMEPLRLDRNRNRAHVYEGDMGTARMHSVADLEELFEYTENLLESLSVVSGGAAYARSDMNRASATETAAALVDQILFGSLDDIGRLRQGRTRDELYARLHEIDDERRSTDEGTDPAMQRHFNQRQFDPAFSGFLELVAPGTRSRE